MQSKFTPYLACLSAALLFFYTILQLASFNAVSTDLIKTFNLSTTAFGALSSLYLYANAFWLLPGGLILDKWSTRKVALTFMSLCVLTAFVFGFSHSLLLWFIARLLGGLGSAMSLLVALRIATLWFPTRSGVAVGTVISLGMLGGVFAGAPFTLLVTQLGWQPALQVVSYIGVAFLLFMAFFLFEKPKTPVPTSSGNLWRQVCSAGKNKQVWIIGAYIGLTNLPIFVFASLWGILYLSHVHYLSADSAGFAIGMIFLGEIVGAPIVGYISDHLHSYKIPMACGSLSALICILPLIFFSPTHLVIYLLLFMVGFAISAQVVGYPTVAKMAPADLVSTTAGLTSLTSNLIGAIFQLVFGWILNMSTIGHAYTAHSFLLAMLIFPGAFLAGLALLVVIKKQT